jgi:hypothetical protein
MGRAAKIERCLKIGNNRRSAIVSERRPMLKIFKGCTEFYGNGNVYLTSGDDVQKVKKHNFEIKALRNDGDDIWIATGLIVAIGVDCEPSDAVRQLKHVLRLLEREAARVGDANECPKCSAASRR